MILSIILTLFGSLPYFVIIWLFALSGHYIVIMWLFALSGDFQVVALCCSYLILFIIWSLFDDSHYLVIKLSWSCHYLILCITWSLSGNYFVIILSFWICFSWCCNYCHYLIISLTLSLFDNCVNFTIVHYVIIRFLLSGHYLYIVHYLVFFWHYIVIILLFSLSGDYFVINWLISLSWHYFVIIWVYFVILLFAHFWHSLILCINVLFALYCH